jgi:hypothetical protein
MSPSPAAQAENVASSVCVPEVLALEPLRASIDKELEIATAELDQALCVEGEESRCVACVLVCVCVCVCVCV